MFFPAQWWQPTLRDRGEPYARLFMEKIATTGDAANTTLDASITTPRDRITILLNACLEATPQAALSVVRVKLLHGSPLLTPASENVMNVAAGDTLAAAAGFVRALNWSGVIYISPGFPIVARATFSAANVANISAVTLHGVTVPQGSIALP